MNLLVAEWIAKAEADYAMASRESRARKHANYDGVCFHYQQCAEKYLKARLVKARLEFARVHDLLVLLDQVLDIEPGWERFREDLAYLSDFAVAYRYPGESADKSIALDAQKRCRRFRTAARKALNITA